MSRVHAPQAIRQALADLIACLPIGIAPKARWRRSGAPSVRYCDQRGEVQDLAKVSTAELLSRARGVWLHTAGTRAWSDADRALVTEFEHRCWTWSEVQYSRASLSVPAWMLGRLPSKWWGLLALVLQAYRRRSIGLLLSYEEIAAICDVSVKTVGRWVEALAEAGLLAREHTWAPPEHQARREQRRNLYQPGPALAALAGGWPGLLEGLDDDYERETSEELAARRRERQECAAKGRREARETRRESHGRRWWERRKARAEAPPEPPAPEAAPAVDEQGRETPAPHPEAPPAPMRARRRTVRARPSRGAVKPQKRRSGQNDSPHLGDPDNKPTHAKDALAAAAPRRARVEPERFGHGPGDPAAGPPASSPFLEALGRAAKRTPNRNEPRRSPDQRWRDEFSRITSNIAQALGLEPEDT